MRLWWILARWSWRVTVDSTLFRPDSCGPLHPACLGNPSVLHGNIRGSRVVVRRDRSRDQYVFSLRGGSCGHCWPFRHCMIRGYTPKPLPGGHRGEPRSSIVRGPRIVGAIGRGDKGSGVRVGRVVIFDCQRAEEAVGHPRGPPP